MRGVLWYGVNARPTESRQVGRPHQIAVALPGRAPSLVDRPDHQALAAPAVAGGKDPRNAGRELAVLGLSVGAGILFDAELFENSLLRAEEAHGEEHEIGGINSLRAGNSLGDEGALCVLAPFHVVDVHLFDPPLLIADEFFAGGEIDARIVAKAGLRLLLAVVQPVDLRPFRPG